MYSKSDLGCTLFGGLLPPLSKGMLAFDGGALPVFFVLAKFSAIYL